MIESTATEPGNGVSKLTLCHPVRRNSDTRRLSGQISGGIRIGGPLLTTCLMLGLALSVQASEWQTNEEIAKVAENYAKFRFGKGDERVAPVAGHLDPRLRLPRCSQPLEPFVRPGTQVTSRTVIGVRCTGSRPWKVYVPVNVVVTQAVLVAKRTLPSGYAVTADDVTLESHDVSRLNGGYLSSIEALSGQRLKHQVIGGRIMTPSMLKADVIVRRGQSVTLVVRNDQMNISMTGKALSDGALNQRIRVENVNSQRVVEGLVRSPEYVEILVHK